MEAERKHKGAQRRTVHRVDTEMEAIPEWQNERIYQHVELLSNHWTSVQVLTEQHKAYRNLSQMKNLLTAAVLRRCFLNDTLHIFI